MTVIIRALKNRTESYPHWNYIYSHSARISIKQQSKLTALIIPRRLEKTRKDPKRPPKNREDPKTPEKTRKVTRKDQKRHEKTQNDPKRHPKRRRRPKETRKDTRKLSLYNSLDKFCAKPSIL